MEFCDKAKRLNEYIDTIRPYCDYNTICFPFVTYIHNCPDETPQDNIEHALSHVQHLMSLFDTGTWSCLNKNKDGLSFSFETKDAQEFMTQVNENFKNENWSVLYNNILNLIQIEFDDNTVLVRPVKIT